MKGLVVLAAIAVSLSQDAAPPAVEVQRLIVASAERHGVPPWIGLRVAEVESQFDCYARGSAGELGPLQIKPATARDLGFDGPDSELRSCGAGLEWGMKHLAEAMARGGVWKHQQGLFAKRRSVAALAYETKVTGAPLEDERRTASVRPNILLARQ
jgi:soluble lytic murein transglycosylase-like protein